MNLHRADIAAGDGAGQGIGNAQIFNIIEGTFEQGQQGLNSLIARNAEAVPEIGGQFDQGDQVVAGVITAAV